MLRGPYCLDIGELGEARPVLFSGGTHDPENGINLIQLTPAHEEDVFGDELSHDTTQGPHIHCCGVLPLSYTSIDSNQQVKQLAIERLLCVAFCSILILCRVYPRLVESAR